MSSKKISRRSFSLTTRLTIWYIIASFALAAFTMGGMYWWLDDYFTGREDRILIDKAQALRDILRNRPEATSELREEMELDSPARWYEAQIYVRLLDENGKPLLFTDGMDAELPTAVFSSVVLSNSGIKYGTDIQSGRAVSFRALVVQAPYGKSGKNWVIQLARDNSHHKLVLANYRSALAVMLVITVIACPLIAYVIARRGIRPVYEIGETARHIGSETLSARIEAAGYPVELGALANTFNAMLDRLEDSFLRISQFSADIAHELRTPIQNLRGAAEVTLSRARSIDEYKEALTSCLEESVRLSDLIGRLLCLARVENPATHLKREQVNLGEELEDVREYYANAASEAGVALSVAAPADLVIVLDRGLVRGAVSNLVANSLSHTPHGGTITLTANAEDHHARIEVRDNGVGIPPQDLPHVFDRFYRADRSRSSHPGSMGLGLAIVKGIVVLHGGKTEIESEVGKGTKIALTFPMGVQPRQPELAAIGAAAVR